MPMRDTNRSELSVPTQKYFYDRRLLGGCFLILKKIFLYPSVILIVTRMSYV